jgi:hypothetical protein
MEALRRAEKERDGKDWAMESIEGQRHRHSPSIGILVTGIDGG